MIEIGPCFLYKDKRWRSLVYDVYLLASWLILSGIEILEYNSSIRTENDTE
jgi:hypothetical protein